MEEEKSKIKIPNVPYKDYLRNIEELPSRYDEDEYIDFWLKHINRCKSGVYTGGIFISGWLYWHLNFFKITVDSFDDYGNPIMEITHPDFRDNEYMLDYAYREAEKDSKKPIPIVGTRRFAKTVFISSRVAFKSYIFQNSHSVVMGASAPDINNITKYIQEYYENRPDCFSDLMKFGEWTKTSSDVEIAFNKREALKRGSLNPITPLLIKLGKDNRYTYSRIAIRNLEHGKISTKEELLAGITPTEVIWDEAGKYLWNKQHIAILPALESPFGKRCVETFVATGGNVDFSTDIERVMINPEKHNFYHFDLEKFKSTINSDLFFTYEQKSDARVGLFVPGEMSLMGGIKSKIPLKDYIKKEYTKKELEELEGFNIEVTNWVDARKKCEDFIKIEYEKSDADGKKAQMYYPFQPEDSFLTTNNNPFPVEEGKKTKKAIEEQNLTGEWVDLDQDEQGEVIIKFSDKKVVTDYPFKGGTHDAPVVLFERPVSEKPYTIKYGTYCAGFDGYKISTSETTDSLGAIYIYKRILTLSGFRKQIVACLATRPTQDSKYYRQCYLLLKMYNAEILPERDTNFRKYMEGIKAMKYWAQCKNLVKGITPNSKANSDDGLPPTPQNKEHILKLVQKYCHEEIIIGYDSEEQPIIIKGIERIPDPMLLEEIIQFGRFKNYDRIMAFGHALAWDEEMTRMGIEGGLDEKQEKEIDPDKLIQMFKHKRFLRSRM